MISYIAEGVIVLTAGALVGLGLGIGPWRGISLAIGVMFIVKMVMEN
jgi:hypothetical protein